MPYKSIEDKRRQSREWQAKWRAENPEKSKETRRKWYYKNQKKVREYLLKYLFGLTPEEYQSLYDHQKGCCAICDIHSDDLSKSLAVDHDHKTGFVRGLLCSSCNLGLGNFKDNIKLLEKAKDYLL